MTVECDDVAEVAAPISRMGSSADETKQLADQNLQPHKPKRAAWCLEIWKGSITCLAQPQRKVLRASSQRHFQSQLTPSKLAELLEIEPTKMGWERRRLARTAKDCGIDLDRLSEIEKVTIDDKPRTAYVGTTLLKSLLEKMYMLNSRPQQAER